MKKFNHENVIRSCAVCVAVLMFAACDQSNEVTTESASVDTSKIPVTTSSDAARELFLEGRALLDDLHFVEANGVFASAVKEDPDFAMGHAMSATTALTAEAFFDAIAKADAAAANASEGEQVFIQALVAGSQNDQVAQREALEELIALYPKDERSHMQLGNYLNGLQDFAGAAEHYSHAIAINPDFASAHNSLGYAHRAMEDFDKAKAAFSKYVALIPDEANPYDSYAELLMEMGNYDESIEQYEKALAIDPYFAASFAGISTNQSLKGNHDRAQEAADRMLAAARNFAERQGALFQSARAYMFAGDTEAAMKVSEMMLGEAEVKRNHAAMGGIYEYMGDAMMTASEAAKAAEHYAAALDHRQRSSINDANKAQAQRTYLFKTSIAAMIGDDLETATAKATEYSAAAEAYGTAFEKRRIHELDGFLAMFNEDNSGAAEHLGMASQLNPIVLYWSAVAQSELGNAERATELAERAANRNTLSANLPFFRQDAIRLLNELQSPDAGDTEEAE